MNKRIPQDSILEEFKYMEDLLPKWFIDKRQIEYYSRLANNPSDAESYIAYTIWYLREKFGSLRTLEVQESCSARAKKILEEYTRVFEEESVNPNEEKRVKRNLEEEQKRYILLKKRYPKLK